MNLPILASSVVIAWTSAVAYKSTSLFVIGKASVCTLMRRSPANNVKTIFSLHCTGYLLLVWVKENKVEHLTQMSLERLAHRPPIL